MSRSVKKNPQATPNTGRVDYPGQSAQITSQTSNDHATGRVDYPIGKYQYINQDNEEPLPAKEVADNSTMVVEYTVTVLSAGPNAEKVADLVLGSSWRRRNINPNGKYSCIIKEAQKAKALELAQKVLDLGAEIEVKKTISIEVRIV